MYLPALFCYILLELAVLPPKLPTLFLPVPFLLVLSSISWESA